MAEWYSVVYVYHIFLIESSMAGHFDGLHVLLEILLFAATWMDLENTILSEISHLGEAKN